MTEYISLKKSLRITIAKILTIVVVFTAVVMVWANWYKLWKLHTQKQVYFTQYTALKVNYWLDEHFRRVLFVSQVSDLLDQSHAYQSKLLNSLIESNAAIADISILDKNLRQVNAQNQYFSKAYDYSINTSSAQQVLDNGVEFIDLYTLSGTDDHTFLELIYPVRTGDGLINGVLYAKLRLSYLQYLISDIDYGVSGYIYLLDPQNHVLVHNIHGNNQLSDPNKQFKDYLMHLKEKKEIDLYRGLSNSYVFGTRERINSVNWFLVVELPATEILYNMHHLIVWVIAILCLSILMAFLLSKTYSKTLIKGLDNLSEAAFEISRGNLTVKVINMPHNELGDVAAAFNFMTAQLQILFNRSEQMIRFEQLLSNITSRVIDSKTIEGKQLIEQIQSHCAIFLGASRSVIYLYNDAQGLYQGKYEWYQEEATDKVTASKMAFDQNTFPVFLPVLKMNHVVSLGISDGEKRLADFMPDLANQFADPHTRCKETQLYQYVNKNDMKHMIGLPIFEGDVFLGLISFGFKDDPSLFAAWTNDNLKTLSNVINSSLMFIKQRIQSVQEHERLQTTLYSIGDAVIATDASGTIMIMNSVAESLTGYNQQDAILLKLSEVFRIIDSDTREVLQNPVSVVLTQRERVELASNAILVSNTGNEYYISDCASPILDQQGNITGVVLVFRDDTEKHYMELEKAKLERLEAVSLLAAGIAHDFNNLLTAILGNLSLARDLIPHYSEAAQIIEAAEASAEKGQDITSQLLVYAKGGIPDKKISSIKKLTKETALFLLKGSRVDYSIEIAPKLHKIHMAEGIFNQILTNVILNAKQAITEDGKITITARNVLVDERFNLPLANGTYVLITVSDNGSGIPQDQLSKIFDPYYTTKNTGSGLGLTSVLSLLKKHGGYITINSKVHEGTRVNLYFAAHGEIHDDTVEGTSQLSKERILCFESDPSLQKMIQKALEPMNVELVITSSMVDLMEWFKISQVGEGIFDAVLLDLNIINHQYMITINDELRKINPNVKIVVVSADIDQEISQSLRKSGVNELLVKPFHIDQLRQIFGKTE